ncbi:hypothetical protein B0H19DRAFT_1264696 [Mycena capillaripes]|nr:hypothetical protein B0H19DRAFT_1264696 [Mycena capillaripes]
MATLKASGSWVIESRWLLICSTVSKFLHSGDELGKRMQAINQKIQALNTHCPKLRLEILIKFLGFHASSCSVSISFTVSRWTFCPASYVLLISQAFPALITQAAFGQSKSGTRLAVASRLPGDGDIRAHRYSPAEAELPSPFPPTTNPAAFVIALLLCILKHLPCLPPASSLPPDMHCRLPRSSPPAVTAAILAVEEDAAVRRSDPCLREDQATRQDRFLAFIHCSILTLAYIQLQSTSSDGRTQASLAILGLFVTSFVESFV